MLEEEVEKAQRSNAATGQREGQAGQEQSAHDAEQSGTPSVVTTTALSGDEHILQAFLSNAHLPEQAAAAFEKVSLDFSSDGTGDELSDVEHQPVTLLHRRYQKSEFEPPIKQHRHLEEHSTHSTKAQQPVQLVWPWLDHFSRK